MLYGNNVQWATYTGHFASKWIRDNPDKLLARIDKAMEKQHKMATSMELNNIWFEVIK